jgi:hypothetical protein
MRSETFPRILLVILAVAVLLVTAGPASVQRAAAEVLRQIPTPFPTPFFPTPFPTPFPPFFTPPPIFEPPTPTPTPDMRVVNELTHPKAGDAIASFAPIVGTALVDDYLKYEVHISPAGLDDWRWLETNFKVVRNGILHVLNTYLLADGFYDLRVRAIRRDGNYSETFLRNLEIRNASPPTPTPRIDALGTVLPDSPISPLFVPPPLPTATPIFRSFERNGQGIFEPQNGDVLRGLVTVVGTANGRTNRNPFARYELYVTETGKDNWGWLFTGEQQLWQSPLFTWDTTTVADGLYDLRLRIVYRDSNYNEYYVTRLRVNNQGLGIAVTTPAATPARTWTPGLFFPRDNIQVTGVIDLVGTTATPNLLRWELAWSPSGAEDWQFVIADAKPVENGVLARLDLSLLAAGSYDFRLRTVRRDYSYQDYHVRNVTAIPPTPTPIPGSTPQP